MDLFLERIKAWAQKNPKTIVFAEGNEPRVKEAIDKLQAESLVKPLIFQDPSSDPRFELCVQEFIHIRKASREEAIQEVSKPHTFATLLVQIGEADGMVAGPTAPSKDRITPALQLIKTTPDGHRASSVFFMILPPSVNADAANGGVLVFADCAVNIDPDIPTLAQIAIDSAESAKQFGLEPKVALLSFSTAGSSQDEHAKSMREAALIAKKLRPDLAIEGELQADAALIDSIGQIKDPGSPIAGHANVLIFPDLESGNIAYKLVERLAGARAIGPIMQGLKKPVNEVSRGSSSEDIFWVALITAVQANTNS